MREVVAYQVQPSRADQYVWFGNPDTLVVESDDDTITLVLTEAMGNRRQTALFRLRRERWDAIAKELAG